MRALEARGIETILVHTGQHYDTEMSDAFFADLGLREPDIHLEVGSASHAVQTARVMERIEPVIGDRSPDLVVVVGDVNSTLAVALVAAKLGVPVAHVEAGLRSYDRAMPEEINRVLTDQVSDLLFTTSPEAEGNLLREGIAAEGIRFVGNPMIDSLERHREQARRSDVVERLGLGGAAYGLVTLHRPSNVDDPVVLAGILRALAVVGREFPIVFPAHPRTVKMIDRFGLEGLAPRMDGAVRGLAVVEPLGYLDFLRLMAEAGVVLTDSGGIQEETTILSVPCLTLRENTERPITIEMGTNRLVGSDPERIRREALAAVKEPRPTGARPPLWDGKAGERIAEHIGRWGAGRASRAG
jgi:UDP-N-acetylglucosamine 2-epimerase (non-hydrolysing)